MSTQSVLVSNVKVSSTKMAALDNRMNPFHLDEVFSSFQKTSFVPKKPEDEVVKNNDDKSTNSLENESNMSVKSESKSNSSFRPLILNHYY